PRLHAPLHGTADRDPARGRLPEGVAALARRVLGRRLLGSRGGRLHAHRRGLVRFRIRQRAPRPPRRLGARPLRLPAEAPVRFAPLAALPFALPPAVAGLVYSDLFAPKGWYGRFLVPLGIQGAYSRLGIVLVLVFIGFPFVVRTLEPVLQGLDADAEEAAACLG